MNKARRKQLEEALGKAEELKETLDSLRDEEQEAYDNLPESIQYGERGDKMQENIDNLNYAVSNLQDCIDNLDEVINAE